MNKGTFFIGQPVFSQLLNLIPRSIVDRLSRIHKSNRYCKRFMAYDHVVSMLYAGFFQCTSLRELTTGLQASSSRLSHLGLKNPPRRSTLSDANQRRSSAFFADLYHELYIYYFSPDSRRGNQADQLFIIDSTTISLFTAIMQAAGDKKANGKNKGGAKAHMMVDAAHDIPAFITITESRENDLVFLKEVHVPDGAMVVMDKAYINYKQFNEWAKRGVKWVTRLRNGALVKPQQELPVIESSRQMGVISDELVLLGRPGDQRTPTVNARLIQYLDQEKGRQFSFITNDLSSEPEVIAGIYKRRWQIELLFKRIKQRYPLKYFLGDNPNAIKIQIWAALLCDLLVRIIQKQINKIKKRPWAYTSISAMIKHHLMNYINLKEFLLNPEKAFKNYIHPTPQLSLFFKPGAYP
jgi:hypothetical protein